jgi:outer membrane lipoprotein-sorting protein
VKDLAMSMLTAPTNILAGLTRRRFLGLAAGAAVLAIGGPVGFGGFPAEAAASDSVQKIADHFSGIRTMTGEFVQFGPRGEQSGGKFYMERPGKIRFDYDGSARFRVVSDGSSVVIENRKMNTMDLYPLSKTPLKLLHDDRIDLSGGKVQSVKEEDDLTTIKLADKHVFGNALITMMFDPKSYELRQWTITDAQGKDTTVMIFNTRQGVRFEDAMFKIDYRKNDSLNAAGR